MSEISKDAQIALNDLGSYSILFGASRIAEDAKEFLVAHIASLESRLAARDALMKKLVNVGTKLINDIGDFYNGEGDNWNAVVAEYWASKDGGAE